ncbi:MAG: hypothetical protein KW793_02135 [Candidatus Doudnabacteria bacterium]|nr:hypothetical protein [Candidatus Doudnabacteria bacterium]
MNLTMKKINGMLVLITMTVTVLMPLTALAEEIDANFNPGILISDQAFSDVGTFGSAAGIQKFLEQRSSLLANTDKSFITKLKEPDTLTKVGLEDPQPDLKRLRTAAELIYDAATKHGLNPQVLLVKLEKEQSLITGNFTGDTLQKRLDRAVGFGCPDYEGCGDIFLSFYRQLFGTFDSDGARWLGAAASLMRSFNTPGGRGPMVDARNQVFGRPVVRTSKVGDSIIFDNTTGGYSGIKATQSVTIGNRATAALYRYTPHVFNGNYNFWKLYSKWFKYPNGTVIKYQGDKNFYVIDNGTKRPFSQFVATQRKLNTAEAVSVSKSEFESYLTDKQMPPLDGTLIKGDVSGSVYLIQDTKKRPITNPVFVQRNFSFADVITLPEDEVLLYDQGAFVTPVNGTLIMGETDGTVYMIDGDLKKPVSYEVFIARKLSFGKILRLSDVEVKAFPSGGFLLPPDQVAISIKGDTGIYWFRDGQKKYISAFVYNQRGVNSFPHIALGAEEFNAIQTSAPFPPRDGSVIQGDKSTGIYIMENGLKRLLTLAAYQRMRNPRPTVLPQTDVDAYASGEIVPK